MSIAEIVAIVVEALSVIALGLVIADVIMNIKMVKKKDTVMEEIEDMIQKMAEEDEEYELNEEDHS